MSDLDCSDMNLATACTKITRLESIVNAFITEYALRKGDDDTIAPPHQQACQVVISAMLEMDGGVQ